jgi:hypothetical protein
MVMDHGFFGESLTDFASVDPGSALICYYSSKQVKYISMAAVKSCRINQR